VTLLQRWRGIAGLALLKHRNERVTRRFQHARLIAYAVDYWQPLGSNGDHYQARHHRQPSSTAALTPVM